MIRFTYNVETFTILLISTRAIHNVFSNDKSINIVWKRDFEAK